MLPYRDQLLKKVPREVPKAQLEVFRFAVAEAGDVKTCSSDQILRTSCDLKAFFAPRCKRQYIS